MAGRGMQFSELSTDYWHMNYWEHDFMVKLWS